MTVWEELKARGLIAQVTDEDEIKEMVNNGKATFYIGFDPTADSLHVGHFMALCLMKRLQMAGNLSLIHISQGVKELILVAQETTVYGTDLYGRKTLHILLKKLCQIRGIRWIRVLYCYPEERCV